MRQRLFQHASRSLFIAPASAPPTPFTTLRLAANATLRSAAFSPICIHAQQLRPQRRHFADDRKPSSGSSSSNEPLPFELPIHLRPPPATSSPTGSADGQTPIATESENKAAADLQGKANIEPEAQSEKAPPSVEPLRDELPSTSEHRRAQLTKRFSHIMDNLQSKLFVASQHINDLTGYSSIDGMKRQITEHESDLAIAKEEVRTSRINYKQLVADRAASQREVTTLLARKDSWTPIDLERFTNLYRSDHGNEHAVQEAAQHLAEVERAAEQAASKLNSSILARYHEEQIWSDKIRRMSTWGTWGLMGVNVLLFLVFQFGFEPWRRERLTRGFEDKVRMALAHERELAYVEHEKLVAENAQAVSAVEKADSAVAQFTAAVDAAGEALGEDVVAEVAPELIAAIEEYADAEAPTAELSVRHEAEAEPVNEAEMAAALDAETETLVSAATPSGDEAAPASIPAPFLWTAPATWASGFQSYVLNPCASFAYHSNERFQDLFSSRKVEVTMQNITVVALEAAATGAAIAGLAVMYFMKPN